MKYTIEEIDALRAGAKNLYLYGSYRDEHCMGMSRSYNPNDLTVFVEEMTRTHMLAGLKAEDLIA